MESLGRRSPSNKLFTSARWNGHLFAPPPPRKNYSTRAANVWGLSSSRHSIITYKNTSTALNGGGSDCDFGIWTQTVKACVRELFTCALRLSPLKHGLYGSGWGVQIWKHRPRDAYAAFTCSLESRLPRELAARTHGGSGRSETGFEPRSSGFISGRWCAVEEVMHELRSNNVENYVYFCFYDRPEDRRRREHAL